MKSFTIRYTFKHVETGDIKTEDRKIEDIEQGCMSGFAAVIPGLYGYALVGIDIIDA